MYQTYRDRAAFVLVYIREAHASDGNRPIPIRTREGKRLEIAEHVSLDARADAAGTCVADLKMTMPCVLDDMKNTANTAYSGWPDRLYVVDIDGKVAMKGGPGPGGFKPAEAEAALKELLAHEGRIKAEK